MGRCECGRALRPGTVQPHQKSAPVLTFVCSASQALPENCMEPTIAKIKKEIVEVFKVTVDDVLLGECGLYAGKWLWAVHNDRGYAETRNEAVREILRRTSK